MSKTTLRESNSITISPREEDADDDQQTTKTTTATLKMTMMKTKVSTNTTNNATISAAEKVFITFKICFPFDLSFPPLSVILKFPLRGCHRYEMCIKSHESISYCYYYYHYNRHR